MGHAGQQPMRRLQLILAILAMMGMEWDVLCNPFSPLQILRWLRACELNETVAKGPAAVKAATSADDGTPAGQESTDGRNARWPKGRSQLDTPSDMHDVIVVRSKTRKSTLSRFILASADIDWLGAVAPAQTSTRHRPRQRPISLLHQICRMQC